MLPPLPPIVAVFANNGGGVAMFEHGKDLHNFLIFGPVIDHVTRREEWLRTRPFVREEGYPHMPGDVRKPLTTGDGFGNYCVTLTDKKGGTMSEWPADLRVREFPMTKSCKLT